MRPFKFKFESRSLSFLKWLLGRDYRLACWQRPPTDRHLFTSPIQTASDYKVAVSARIPEAGSRLRKRAHQKPMSVSLCVNRKLLFSSHLLPLRVICFHQGACVRSSPNAPSHPSFSSDTSRTSCAGIIRQWVTADAYTDIVPLFPVAVKKIHLT